MKTLATVGIGLVALEVMLSAAGAADVPVVSAPEPVPKFGHGMAFMRIKCWFRVGAVRYYCHIHQRHHRRPALASGRFGYQQRDKSERLDWRRPNWLQFHYE